MPEDTNVALALHEQEAAEAAERCSRCGMPRATCRNPEHQFQFVADVEQCHASAAIEAGMAKFGEGANSSKLVWSAYLRSGTGALS